VTTQQPYKQHPLDVRLRTVDWTKRLDGASLSTSTWQASSPAGLTLSGGAIAAGNKKATVFTSGGTLGVTYTATDRVTTNDGQTLDFSILVEIVEEVWRREAKDPNAEETYAVEWDTVVPGVTISSFDFTVPTGLTKLAQSQSGTDTLVKIAGGTAGETYRVLCKGVTGDGETIHLILELYVTDV
jgi:hypothetical protein